jgi:protein disulfide-isomerase A6
VRGYPTIKVFSPGKTDKPEDYNGGRSASDIVTYARNAAERFAKPRPVVQVTTRAELEEQCKEKASLCLLTVLPSIYDGGAKARNAALATLGAVAKKYARKPFAYVWIEAGSQPALEDILLQGNTFFPAVVALNLKKSRYSPMVGSFTPESVGEFLNRLLSGREATIPLPGGAEAVLPFTDSKEGKWDGKDGKPPEEEKEL